MNRLRPVRGLFLPTLAIPRASIAVAVMLLTFVRAQGTSSAQETRRIEIQRTANNLRFGIIRDDSVRLPAPTLFVFATAIEGMQTQPIYTEVSELLVKQGWVSIVIDPPCHGEDMREGEPPRLAHQEEFVTKFTEKVSSVLDHLIDAGIADPKRIAACGTSRGGFLAYQFAAAEKRVRAVAGISPVTRLTALREFSERPPLESADRLNTALLAPQLVDRAVWLSIGNNDARVNTDDAIAFTRGVVHAAALQEPSNKIIPVELIVGPSAGHSKIDHAHELLAVWLVKQIPQK
jgi:dienelactone hydrolase